MNTLTYRSILKPLLFAILLGTAGGMNAQEEFDGLRGTHKWMSRTDAPNSLYKYISGEAYKLLQERSDKVAGINTLSEWKERQEWLKTTLMDVVGPFPEKTPLNPRITGVVERDTYRVENLIYESQPGFYVTASLFIPNDLKEEEQAPAIIFCSGHSEEAYRPYTNVLVNLVNKGFVVFAFDPIGQGERLGYYDEEKDKSIFKWPTWEHSYPGAQVLLTGDSMAKYFIWDGIRAVDYLLTREEVDPARLGIHGRSGGGTQSALIGAFDDRIKAVAPELYITSYTRLFESMGPQDAEQNFPNGIERGLDMADLLAVRAPKPALVGTTTRDMFPIQGSIETVREVSRIYEAYGKPENFGMASADAPHKTTKENREAMYAFFQEVLDNPGDPVDREISGLTAKDLQVTETGQILTSLDGESTFSLNLKRAEEKQKELEDSRKDLDAHFPRVLKAAKELSGYQEPEAAEAPQFTGRAQREGYTIEKKLVKGQGDYLIPYLVLEPEEASGKGLIYLHPEGKAVDAEVGGDLEKFVKAGFTVLAPDLVGTGELGPGDYKGDAYIDSTSYNIWFAGMLVGKSIVGIQTSDVIKLKNLFQAENQLEEIYGLAKGEMAPILLHAAAFDDDLTRIALLEPYSSYFSLVNNRMYESEFLHSTVPGAIGQYDLPDLAASLAPEELIMLGVVDGTGTTVEPGELNEEFSVIRAAYKNAGAKENFILRPGNNVSDILDIWTGKNEN